MKIWRLDDGRQTLVLAARDRRLPEVVYWGAPLPVDTDCASLARAGRIDVTGGMLDEIPDLSICPEAARSFPGQPGLVVRDGGGEPLLPSFRYVREESGGDAGSLLLVFADRAHDLTYTARFDTDRATGVMTLRATLEAGSAVRVDWFAAPVLPAPALADEMIDFAGRWCGEFRPTGRPGDPAFAFARIVPGAPGAPGTSTFPVSWFPAAAPPTPEAWHTPSTTAGPAATGWLPKSYRTAGARSSSATPRIRSATHRPASRPPRSTWCAPTAVSTAAQLHSSGTCAPGSCAFPGIEIETSASGGGRIDFGILARTHRVWLSDSNDALERLRIQHNAALFLPGAVTGSHVGPRRCHTSGRILDISFLAWVAAQRQMGLELDPRELTEREAEVLSGAIAWYKRNRDWLHRADVLRLDSPDPEVIGEQHLSEDGSRFAVFLGKAQSGTPIAPRPQPLTRLDPDARYRVRLVNAADVPPLSRATPVLGREAVEAPGVWLTDHGLTLPWSFPETMWVIEGGAAVTTRPARRPGVARQPAGWRGWRT